MVIVSVCVSVHTWGGGVTPSPSHYASTGDMTFLWGGGEGGRVPHLHPIILRGRGCTPTFKGWSTLLSRRGLGIPNLGDDGYPLSRRGWGTPSRRGGWGTPHPTSSSGTGYSWMGYGAGFKSLTVPAGELFCDHSCVYHSVIVPRNYLCSFLKNTIQFKVYVPCVCVRACVALCV